MAKSKVEKDYAATLKSWLPKGIGSAIGFFVFIVGMREADQAAPSQIVLHVLRAFTGQYSPLPGMPATPSPMMAFAMSLAMVTTFATVTAMFLKLSHEKWNRLTKTRQDYDVAIVGRGKYAESFAEVLSQSQPQKKIVVITQPGAEKKAGQICAKRWPVLKEDAKVSRVLKNAKDIVVAGQDDTESAELVRGIPAEAGIPHQLVIGEDFAPFVRPRSVQHRLPATLATSPVDNIAQHVTEVLTQLVGISSSQLKINIKIDQESLLHLVTTRVNALIASDSFIRESVQGVKVPRISLAPNIQEANVHIVGGSLRNTLPIIFDGPDNENDWVIAIVDEKKLKVLPNTPEYHLTNGNDLPTRNIPLVIDKDAVGLEPELVLGDMIERWGRVYNQAHALLYPKNGGGKSWSKPHGREEQSSIKAAEHMLRVLGEHGYALERGANVEPGYPFSSEEVSAIARAEHEDWLNRIWIHPITEKELHCSNRFNANTGKWEPGPDAKPWEELPEDTIAYMEKVPKVIYPALAALLGYRIVKVEQPKLELAA